MSTHAPRVLVSGIVLAQRSSGVRRFAEQVLPRVAATLREDGGELALLEPKGGTGLCAGTAIRSIPSDVSARSGFGRVRAERRALQRAIDAAQEDRRPFDLALTGHLPTPAVTGIEIIQLIHDLRVLTPLAPFWKRIVAPRLLRQTCERASVVVCVGAAVQAELQTRFQPQATRVLGHGGDHLQFVPRRPEGFVLFVGHLEPRKNLELLLQVWQEHVDLPPLVVAGAGPDESRLAALLAERGLSQRVQLKGAIDDTELSALYARAGCAVFPSRLEGFGIGILEARRAGVPLAISQIPGHEGRIAPSDACFTPDDPSGCAEAIRAALRAENSAIQSPASVPTWTESAAGWTSLFRERVGVKTGVGLTRP